MSFFKKSDLHTDRIDDNSSRIVMARGGSLMYARIFFDKGLPASDPIPLHHHLHEQITYVLKGSFKFEINDADGQHVDVVREGDSLYLPSNSDHGCIPLDDDSQLIDCFTPQRQDFLR